VIESRNGVCLLWNIVVCCVVFVCSLDTNPSFYLRSSSVVGIDGDVVVRQIGANHFGDCIATKWLTNR
jgi:hypothetical protein